MTNGPAGMVAAYPREPFPEPSGDAVIFVWGAWALLVGIALYYVGQFGSNMPFDDEWAILGGLTGQEILQAEWFWSPTEEDRLPLPKLLMLAAYRLSGKDFRGEMY